MAIEKPMMKVTGLITDRVSVQTVVAKAPTMVAVSADTLVLKKCGFFNDAAAP